MWRDLKVDNKQVENSFVWSDEDGKKHSVFHESSKPFNLNELSKNPLGKNEGTIDAKGYVIAAYNGPEQLKGELKYEFENQPYSSYGVVYSKDANVRGNHDFEELFYLAVDGKSSDLVDAIYKGKVFARAKVGNSEDDYSAKPTIDEDGNVELNVKKSSDKFEMSGIIDSTTVGKIKLLPKEIKENKVKGSVAFEGDGLGNYSAIVSKDSSDVVGRVKYESDGSVPAVKDGTKYLFEYEAVFGGEKQKQ
ncbi:hypothetical protein EUX48_07905 [Haemophilus haemolyticus]|uniref:Transferrin-binding protein B C-lobe/N-lobe beta barrel domain-containing protein n=1 Tax=Haemophilus haemolyticus TaxID=726 RepID=A0A502LAZ4_HAEHA|nr:hypothetical protein EUX48_07905 [Haemophilus haemolyticus]